MLGLLSLGPLAKSLGRSPRVGLSTIVVIIIIIIIIALGTLAIYFLLATSPGSTTITFTYT